MSVTKFKIHIEKPASILGADREDEILSEQQGLAKGFAEKRAKELIRIEEAIQSRLDKGLKTNKITNKEMEKILVHWIANGMKMVSKSVKYVYDNTDKVDKEVDWVKSITRTKYHTTQLLSAIFESNHPKLKLLQNNSRVGLRKTELRQTLELTKRIRSVKEYIGYEDELIEKEEKIEELQKKLDESLKYASWEYKAEVLLSSGMKQQAVADEVGKGIATIKRLAKKLKEK